MASRGRPPKPVEQKRLNGNPGRRQLPDPVVELVAADGVPRMPAHLSPDLEGYWAELWSGPGRAWISPQLDTPLVEQACRQAGDCVVYRSLVDEHGPLLEEPITAGQQGQIVGYRKVPNPAVAMLRQAEKAFLESLRALSIPPAERARLGLAQVKAASKFDELRARQQQRLAAPLVESSRGA